MAAVGKHEPWSEPSHGRETRAPASGDVAWPPLCKVFRRTEARPRAVFSHPLFCGGTFAVLLNYPGHGGWAQLCFDSQALWKKGETGSAMLGT